MTDYILGAGINGLLSAYFLKSYKVIGLSETQDSNSFPLGPRLLHYSLPLQELLQELKLDDTIKKIKIGYFYDDSLHNTIPDNLKKQYFLKSRGAVKNTKKSYMSGELTSILVFKATPQELFNRLKEVVGPRIIEEKITCIDPKNRRVMTDANTYTYTKLISTLPAPVFFRLTGRISVALTFFAREKKFFLTNKFIDIKDYEYVYFPEIKNHIHRITKFEDKLVVECEKDIEAIGSKVIKNMQICSDAKVPTVKDTVFIGRYACWNHSKKINEVVEDVKNLCN
jgi:protoporphyrinogen oxidase